MKRRSSFFERFLKEYSLILRWIVIESFKKGLFKLGIRGFLLSFRLAYLGAQEGDKKVESLPESPFVYTMQ